MGIRKMLARRQARKVFGKYISPEVLEKILRETPSESQPPETQHFQYVVVFAEDSNAQKIPEAIAKILEICVQHRANVSHMSAALFVAILGVPFPDLNSAELRHKLVDALLREDSVRLRIAHGECDGIVGLFGGPKPKRRMYGEVIPGFSMILKKLLETDFGTAVEIN